MIGDHVRPLHFHFIHSGPFLQSIIAVFALLFAALMAHFPAPPSWVPQALGGQALPRPPRPCKIVLPCAGIDAPGRAITELGVEAEYVGIWDSDEKVLVDLPADAKTFNR